MSGSCDQMESCRYFRAARNVDDPVNRAVVETYCLDPGGCGRCVRRKAMRFHEGELAFAVRPDGKSFYSRQAPAA